MTGQDFNTLDVLELMVSEDPTGIYNLIENPGGIRGGWGWLTPAGGVVDSVVALAGPLEYTNASAGASYFTSDYLHVEVGAGIYAAAAFQQQSAGNAYHRARFEYFDAGRNLLGSTAQTALTAPSASADVVVPAALIDDPDTAYIRLRVDLYTSGGANPTGAHLFRFTAAAVATSPDEPDLDDIEPGLAGLSYVNILAPAHEIIVDRPGFNIGTLTAIIIDESMDPADNDTVRPGRRVRLRTADLLQPLFTGEIHQGSTSYLRDPSDNSTKVRIEIVAVDPASQFANAAAPSSVLGIEDLAHVIEPIGVPWVLNGSTGHVTPPEQVAVIESASALDQIALTRDTNLAYAWISRFGILNVWEPALIPDLALPTTVSDTEAPSYSSIDVDWSTETCINSVTVKLLTYDPATSETLEATFGPFEDLTSIATWGRKAREFTVVGIEPEAYAVGVLTANANPVRRCNAITMPVKEDTLTLAYETDLYDRLHIVLGTKFDDTLRVTGIKHRITAAPSQAGCRWYVDYTFDALDSVAQPTRIPSPTGQSGVELGSIVRCVARDTRDTTSSLTGSEQNVCTATIPYPIAGRVYKVTGFTNIEPDTAGQYSELRIRHGINANTGGTEVARAYVDHRVGTRIVGGVVLGEFEYTGDDGQANYNVVLTLDASGGDSAIYASASNPAYLVVEEIVGSTGAGGRGLPGPTGPPGADGAPGADGTDGADGADGADAPSTKTFNAQTGTSYTLVLADGDLGKFVTMSNAAASTLTIPPNSAVAFPIGAVIEGAQLGAGQVTLTPGSGVTLRADPGAKIAARYGTFALVKLATDEWLAMGRLSA